VCPTSCDTHDDCIATHFCDVDACEPLELPGSPCSDAFECASGICADGVCCDAACAGQCEACDVAGAEGTCTLVMGQPHAGHEPCPSDGCSGGVGDTAYSCSGEATCTPLLTTCEPYACASDGCYETCLSDAQCVDGYDCVLETGVCISRDPICDGVDELALPGGGTLPCRPYRCTALGACLDGCISSGDCSPGFACSSDQRCVERPPPIEPPGCAYRSAPAPDRSPTTFLWLIAAAWIAQRRSQTAKTFARTRARL
jgi:hypothetical protein